MIDPGMDPGEITLLMKEYSGTPDFQFINLGRLGLSFVKELIRHSDDKDAIELLTLMRKVNQISIASFGDCDQDVRDRFAARLSQVLDKEFLLVEAKDSDEKVQIFAIPSKDGENISDLIISAPGSGALVCVRGLIKVSEVASFLEAKVN